MTRLTPHFTLEEFTFSQTASRKGIDNTPDKDAIQNLQFLAERMEDVRELLGTAIHISSGYRCLELNTILGSKPSSQHTQGLACDFKSSRYGNPSDIVFAIVSSNIHYDQIILEYHNPNNPDSGWVHISFSQNNPRKEALIINKNGTTIYSKQ